MIHNQDLRIIVIKEDGILIAQCLEYDICTQAADMDTLKDRMNCLLEVELKAGQAIDQAPERFHKMWDVAISVLGDDSYRIAA
jgi:hypothetical protein